MLFRGCMVKCAMNQEELERFYLAKAREADELARITREQDARERWLLLAEGYRTLARGRLGPAAAKE